jgi:hypothetical protein
MIFLTKLGAGVLGTAVVGAAALSSQGFIHVNVREKGPNGDHIRLIVPAAVVPIAMQFAPHHDLEEAARQIREYRPIVDAALPALEECSDGVLVEVVDRTDHVVIAKSGGSIVIDVNDPGDTVHVSVPLRTVQRSLHQIADSSHD